MSNLIPGLDRWLTTDPRDKDDDELDPLDEDDELDWLEEDNDDGEDEQ